MVCKSWNVAASITNSQPKIPWLILAPDHVDKKRTTTSNNNNNRSFLRQVYSLTKEKLLLSNKSRNNTSTRSCSSSSSSSSLPHRQIYSVSTGKKIIISNKKLYFPSDTMCIGLKYGWILTISKMGGHMNLVHPLSGSEINLPKQSTIEKRYFQGTHPNPSVNIYRTFPTYMFTRRAVLSGNPSESPSDFGLMIVHSGGARLGYWKPGDTCWTSTDERDEGGFFDLIYYKDQFYAFSFFGIKIWACVSIDNPSCSNRSTIELRQIMNTMDYNERFRQGLRTMAYIVESALPDVLLLVVREDVIGADFKSVGKLYEDTDMKYELIDFQVYELDLVNRSRAKKILNLGDRAIFVGQNSSISFVASHFSGIKPNHIYFTDDCDIWYRRMIKGGGSNNMGCYSLEDAKITQFNVGESRSRLTPPFWYIPSF